MGLKILYFKILLNTYLGLSRYVPKANNIYLGLIRFVPKAVDMGILFELAHFKEFSKSFLPFLKIF